MKKGCRLGRRPEKQGPRHQLSNRDWVDKLATERKLKVTKEELSIGTWNVRTLWAAGKLDLLNMEMERYRCDILGIAEMRCTGAGEMDGCSVIWSGDETKHEAGVGFLLNKKARGAMLGYKPVSDRIIVARFQAQPFNISVIQIYAPTSDSTQEEVDTFYGSLLQTMTEISRRDILVIGGDWNAKVGQGTDG